MPASCWERGPGPSRYNQPGQWQAGQCWCHQQPGAHRNHPQVELLGLVDLQDPADAAIDNVTFVQCDPDVLPPGAKGMSEHAGAFLWAWWAGGDPAQSHQAAGRWVLLPGGCQVILTCPHPRDRAAAARALGPEHTSCPLAFATPRSMGQTWGVGQGGGGGEQLCWAGERDIWGTCLLSGFFIRTTLPMVTSLWPELSCNFETGLCGWYQDQASDFQWVHSTGQGQGSDHTTGSGKGPALLMGARPAGGTLQPPVPRVGRALRTLSSTGSPPACGTGSATAAQGHPDPGLGA